MRLSDAYTITQAAEMLRLNRAYTLQLAKDMGLLRQKVGSSYVLSAADIEVLRARPKYSDRRSKRYDRHGTKGKTS